MGENVDYFAVEGAGTTVVHPLGLLLLFVCGVLLVLVPRRYALWPFLILVCLVSSRQCIAVGGLNLYFARCMVLFFGIARILSTGEWASLKINALDLTVLGYAALYLLAGSGKLGFDPADVKQRLGYLVEVVGIYLLVRIVIQSIEDVQSIVICLALAALPVAGFFMVESATGRNVFSVFGGVPPVTAIRDGRLRCQGAFAHPILAGVVWASFLPFIIYGAVRIRKHRWVMILGSAAAISIVVLSASSTPALGLVVGLAGLALFPLRQYARRGFGLLAVLLICLHFSMKAPVWSLIQRINVTPGDSGYHRYILVDGFIRHWDEWWLLGTTVGTRHWGHFTFDISNHFVAVGANAGLAALLLFVSSIAVAMLYAGRVQVNDPLLGWALGVCVFVHCLCFLGVSVWGQLHFAWNLPLGVLGSMGYYRPRQQVRARPHRAEVRGASGCGSGGTSQTAPVGASQVLS